jgi:hypothetical protein
MEQLLKYVMRTELYNQAPVHNALSFVIAAVACSTTPSHAMLVPHMHTTCPAQRRTVCCDLPHQDVEFAFERSRLKEWIADIKMLIQKDLRGIPGWGAHTR